MKLVHELWNDESVGEFTFCLAGPAGDGARATLSASAKLIWSCEAESYFEAMTRYYEYQDWGEYSSEFSKDHWPYVNVAGEVEDQNAKKA